MSKGKLYLVPCPIADHATESIPEESLKAISKISHIVCERARTTRRQIKNLMPSKDISSLNILEGGHHFDSSVIKEALQWLNAGVDTILMSEAGSPAIADPGTELVLAAHQNNIKIKALSGPNSICMALMASGLSGQEFCFHGYLPHKKDLLKTKLQDIIHDELLKAYTHICIEAPYRNHFLFRHLSKLLPKETLLCIASGIQSGQERIWTKRVIDWKDKDMDAIHKVPSIFLFRLAQ